MDDNSKHRINVLLIVLLVLTLCFIWGNSLLDREESSELSHGLLEQLAPLLEELGVDTEDDHWLRKLAHFAEFGLLGAELGTLFYLNAGFRVSSGIKTAGLSLLVAASDETLQFFTGRGSQVRDVLLDLSGAMTAVLLLTWIWYAICKRDRKKPEA